MIAEPRGRLRRAPGSAPAPVRIVHLGLSAFARAHQAWYTGRLDATPNGGWGIAAFTGRGPDAATRLQGQDCLYTLVTRSSTGDGFEIVSSISEAHPASDVAAWVAAFSSDAVTLVTLTITEAGYCLDASGALDLARADVRDDVAALRQDPHAAVVTAPSKLVQGLRARRDRLGAGLAVVSCDNLASNGERTRGVVLSLAAAVDGDLHDWIAAKVTFPGTMVDRITPRVTDADRQLVLEDTGWIDEAPVVTEPFSEWVIEDDFPAGRPAWDLVGARFVSDVRPWEQRKLLLLNGAHSLLAYLGQLRGYATVAEAIIDPECRAAVARWWSECSPLLEFDDREIADYCASLLSRWENPRIRHQLAQIALDGSLKLRMRAAPVVCARAERGLASPAACLLFAAWLAWLRRPGADVAGTAIHDSAIHDSAIHDTDPAVPELARLGLDEAIRTLVNHFVPGLPSDAGVEAGIRRAYDELVAAPPATKGS